MARDDVAKLYQELIKSGFAFVPEGQHSLQEVYGFVKSEYPQLCDDRFLCSQNCSGGSNSPEWQHVVRKALYELLRLQSPAVYHVRRGIWFFSSEVIDEQERIEKEAGITRNVPIAGSPTPNRVAVVTSRVERNTALAKWLKEIHNYECQICGMTILLPHGKRYAEVHHLRPLGEPHNGPDIPENMIVVCPNHHVMCDYGAIKLSADELRTHPQHKVGREFVQYHNSKIYNP